MQPGEQYALSSGKLFCQNHFDSLPSLDQPAPRTPLGELLVLSSPSPLAVVHCTALRVWASVCLSVVGVACIRLAACLPRLSV